jgi:hypothetical protein
MKRIEAIKLVASMKPLTQFQFDTTETTLTSQLDTIKELCKYDETDTFSFHKQNDNNLFLIKKN